MDNRPRDFFSWSVVFAACSPIVRRGTCTDMRIDVVSVCVSLVFCLRLSVRRSVPVIVVCHRCLSSVPVKSRVALRPNRSLRAERAVSPASAALANRQIGFGRVRFALRPFPHRCVGKGGELRRHNSRIIPHRILTKQPSFPFGAAGNHGLKTITRKILTLPIVPSGWRIVPK